MATILIHAGMPKAGSTAIQEFLRRSYKDLASREGVVVAVASPGGPGQPAAIVKTCDDHNINSNQLIQLILNNPSVKEEIMRSLIAGLERLARNARMVVLTSEGLTQSIWQADPAVLQPFARLATSHSVRISYYIRPQHTALEAAWRQWGFRTGRPPATYLEHRARQLHYLETRAAIRKVAPQVELTMRPFRDDLLTRGDVVSDFAQHFLGCDADSVAPFSEMRENIGMSLEVTNLLSPAPRGLLGAHPHDNRRFDVIKQLLKDIEAPASERVERGRRILQNWCHRRFEHSNHTLLKDLGWSVESFVEATACDEAAEDLSPINCLWTPSASPMEMQAFFRLLSLHLE